MKRFAVRSFAVSALAAALAAPALVQADLSPEEEAIKYRQGIFNAIRWNVGPMGAMVKGEVPFDAAAFTRHAERLQALSDMPFEAFGPGTDKGGNTTARGEIWSKRADFDKKAEDFRSEAAKLVTAARAGDQGAIRSQFATTTRTCKSCHDDFRARR